MRSKEKVLAIFLSDIHLSLNPPIWRSNEPDWFKAMARPLDEINKLRKTYECPVICAGDIFDKWDSLPELINFALERLPDNMYAIPGQHDLPLHNYKDINKSAYWTLVKANKIKTLFPVSGQSNIWVFENDIVLHGFPFGYPITPLSINKQKKIHIAICHEYRCIKGKDYSKASKSAYFHSKEKNLLGYDVMIYGDNHQGFLIELRDAQIFNCGTLMKRKVDEEYYKPFVGLLLESGKVMTHYLDTSEDKHLELEGSIETENIPDLKSLIQELEKLDNTDLDFPEVMMRYLKRYKIKKPTCNIIIKAMDYEHLTRLPKIEKGNRTARANGR